MQLWDCRVWGQKGSLSCNWATLNRQNDNLSTHSDREVVPTWWIVRSKGHESTGKGKAGTVKKATETSAQCRAKSYFQGDTSQPSSEILPNPLISRHLSSHYTFSVPTTSPPAQWMTLSNQLFSTGPALPLGRRRQPHSRHASS